MKKMCSWPLSCGTLNGAAEKFRRFVPVTKPVEFEACLLLTNCSFPSSYISQTAEDKRMQTRVLNSVGRVLAVAILAFVPVALVAQAAPSAKGSGDQSPSRWDIFAGYSYLAPKRRQ